MTHKAKLKEPLSTRAEVRIDIDAYKHNINVLQSALSLNTQLWVVVKADAYGHGSGVIAKAAVEAGIARLCVATLSEARFLRDLLGEDIPILIMGPLNVSGVRSAIDLGVSFAVLNEHTINVLQQVYELEDSPQKKALVHLKVDTGMGRWGVPLDNALSSLRRLEAIDGVNVEGLMTHFASADDMLSDFFELQLERFTKLVDQARDISTQLIVHAANSAASMRSDSTHFDAVRCGIASYGMDPFQADASLHNLKPVLSVRSNVADIRTLKAGESTGYNQCFIASGEQLIAEVPIGYADGVRRAIGKEKGVVLIKGKKYPIVGNVSMDHISILVDNQVCIGDVVTVIGSDENECITAEDHARWAQTISYEITCGISDEPRIMRNIVGS